MTLNDLLIIYLSCGAPFGVYYFFDKKSEFSFRNLIFKSFLVFVFWIPLAFSLLLKKRFFGSRFDLLNTDFDKEFDSDLQTEEKLAFLQKQFEKILLKNNLTISIYEFREVVERYIGLSFAKRNAEHIINSVNKENEIFIISKNSNPALSTVCLNRRNRKRLSFHHINARQDFLKLIDEFFLSGADKENLSVLSFEFVKLLKDSEAENSLQKLFEKFLQSDKATVVSNTENDLWKTEAHKQSPANQLSIQLQTLTATANLRRKD